MHYPTRHPLPTLEDRIVAQLALSPATRSQLCEALDTSRTNLAPASYNSSFDRKKQY